VALVNQFPAATLTGVDHAFALEDFITDTDGSGHARLSRTYRGLQVIGGDLVVHSDRLGNFRNSSQTLERFINVPLTPGISAATARVVAQTFFAGIASGNAPELVVFARTALPELAFDVRISSVKSDGTPSERHVIINARTGAVMETWDDVQTAPATGSGNGFFSGVVGLSTNSLTATSFELRDTTRGGQYTLDMQNKADTTLLGIVIRKAANGPSSRIRTTRGEPAPWRTVPRWRWTPSTARR
jgi:Zn-dependent metalloprotease